MFLKQKIEIFQVWLEEFYSNLISSRNSLGTNKRGIREDERLTISFDGTIHLSVTFFPFDDFMNMRSGRFIKPKFHLCEALGIKNLNKTNPAVVIRSGRSNVWILVSFECLRDFNDKINSKKSAALLLQTWISSSGGSGLSFFFFWSIFMY